MTPSFVCSRVEGSSHSGGARMELFGFGWTEIVSAFAAATTALVLLHLVRLKRRVVEVPSLAFFVHALPDERSHLSFARLRNWLLLALMLLAAAAISFAMGLPELPRHEGGAQRDIVLLIDATASMQARTGSTSRFERARHAALRVVDGLPTGSRALVLRIAASPEVVLAWTSDREALRQAIEHLEASESAGSAQPALSWAQSTCNHAIACRIHLFTDGGLDGLAETSDARLETQLFGDTESQNAAISAFSARRFPADPTRAEVLLDVTNYGNIVYEGELSIAADRVVVHREDLHLAPGEHVTRTFDRITGANALLTAHIETEGADSLSLDDTAYARIPPRRRRHLTLVGVSHAYLDAALLLDPYLEVRAMEPSAFETARTTTPELFAEDDVWLFDGYTPVEAPTLPALLLHPSEASWLEVSEPIGRPHFEEEQREHPVLRYIALGDVNIAEADPIVPRAGLDEVLAGEPRGALLVRGEREHVPFLALAFDVRASDFALRIGWPIFLAQALAHLSPDDVQVTEGAQTGDTISLPWPADAEPSLRFEAQSETFTVTGVRHADGALFSLERVGAYWGHEDGLLVANLFSPSESTPPRVEAAQASSPPRVDENPDANATFWLHDISLTSALMALALAVLILEWLVFHRRSA